MPMLVDRGKKGGSQAWRCTCMNNTYKQKYFYYINFKFWLFVSKEYDLNFNQILSYFPFV